VQGSGFKAGFSRQHLGRPPGSSGEGEGSVTAFQVPAYRLNERSFAVFLRAV
jgi:hypothetical protein